MWQILYVQAHELAQERVREANRERLARDARVAHIGRQSRLDGLRRGGAIVAAGIARRLDECVAREQLAVRSSDDRLQLPS